MINTIFKMKIIYLFFYLLTNESVLESVTELLMEYGLHKWLKAGWKTRPRRLISGTESSWSQSPAVHPCTGTSLVREGFHKGQWGEKPSPAAGEEKPQVPGMGCGLTSSFAKKHLKVLVNNYSTLHWWGPTWSAVFTPGIPNHQRQGSTGVSPAKGQ